MYFIVVFPIFIISVFTGVQSWLWRSSLIAIVAIAWYLWGIASVAVAIAFILGIAAKNSLPKFS